MFSIERIFVTGGIMLLSVLTLIFGSSKSDQIVVNLNNEAIITATALGQSLLEEIESRAFDENTVSTYAEFPNELTSYALLGPESGEINSTQFNDIDDFNNYSNLHTLSRLGDFLIAIEIFYVSPQNPEIKVTSRTFSKRIIINITNPYLLNRIQINKIVSY